MSSGIFIDETHYPGMDEILDLIGEKHLLWEELSQYIRTNFNCPGELLYCSKSYGWTLRFRLNGIVLLSLYPGENSFTAQIVLGEAQVERARAAGLSAAVLQAIDRAYPYQEGRWVFIDVATITDVADIQLLLEIKTGHPIPKPAESTVPAAPGGFSGMMQS